MVSEYIKIGINAIIEENVVIGAGNKELGEIVIGDNAIIRSGTVIYYGVKIGNYFRTGHNAVIRENNIIGNNVSIGGCSELNVGNKIGNNTSIHYGCFLERTTIGEYVFIAPNVTFLDDLNPVNPDEKSWAGAAVGDDVAIGGNSVISPKIKIGNKVLIGMGSVVTKDIPDEQVWFGNPAKYHCKLSELKHKNYGLGYMPGNRMRYKK